jgi:hypothetical protein
MTTAFEISRTGLFRTEERCDRCAARARVRVVLEDGELTFCEHHARRHRVALKRTAVRIEYHVDSYVD